MKSTKKEQKEKLNPRKAKIDDIEKEINKVRDTQTKKTLLMMIKDD